MRRRSHSHNLRSGKARVLLPLVILSLAILQVNLPWNLGASVESTLGYADTDWTSKVDSSLLDRTGPVRVLLTVSSEGLGEVTGLLQSFRAIPLSSSSYVVRATIPVSEAKAMASIPSVVSIVEDRPIDFGRAFDRPVLNLPLGFLPNENSATHSSSQERFDRSELGAPETQLRDVIELTGVAETWERYELVGSSVTIAVIDTGVDYSSLTLGYWDVIPRTEAGAPATFDADGESFILTSLTLTETSSVTGSDRWLATNGSDPQVYLSFLADPPYRKTPPIARFSELTGENWPYAMNITGIDSLSGNFHFGIFPKYYEPGYPDRPFLFFPILLVDNSSAGVYDTVYVDVTSAWELWSGSNPDFSFSDEAPLTTQGRITAAKDLTGDGIYDVSAGTLGHFLDIWGAAPNGYDRGGVLLPIDPSGNYVVLSDDWWGHGTFVAASAGGRDPSGLGLDARVGPGIAPGSRIMGIVALFYGDILEAHMWAAGFDLQPLEPGWITSQSYGGSYGIWRYTGNHSADIISNSWGISAWPLAFNSQPWYDLMAVFQDALSVPGYLDPSFPGVTIVHAVGNGGPGYGTITSPGYSSLAIGVGASTSFGSASPVRGSSDQVISWSARGPTPFGTVKPDLVNVGAWAWVAGPTWVGEGRGAESFDVFGGTSMATPLTAGSAALVIEGYEKAHGHKPDPQTVKTILKSTARDLGYDAFVQGAGRIDVFRAVSMANSISGVLVDSEGTWSNLRRMLSPTWNMLQVSYGNLLKSQPPPGPIPDFGWYAGTVTAGSTTNATLRLHNFDQEPATVTLEPKVMVQAGDKVILNGVTSSGLEGWLEGVGDLVPLPHLNIPNETDLLVARLAVNFSYFDIDSDYNWDRRFRLFILGWSDDGDGIPQTGEVNLVNYGYNAGTIVETRVGFPTSAFKGIPFLWISQVGSGTVPYQVEISFFSRQDWSWVQADSGITVAPSSSSYAGISIAVPLNTKSGVYEGQIAVSSLTGQKSVLPVSVVVSARLSPDNLSLELRSDELPEIYDPSRVNGLFDWRWRYESGDWRSWYFTVEDPRVISAIVSSQWEGQGTDVDMFSVNSAGIIVGGTGWQWLGRGIFEKTTSGHLEEFATLYPGTVPGIHTVLLHNVLSGGSPLTESLRVRVQFVLLDPAPTDVPMIRAIAGSTAIQDFVLSSGRVLTDVRFTLEPTDFLVDVTGLPRTIAENSANRVRVQMGIPERTPPGVYTLRMRLYSRELSVGVPIELHVQVENQPTEAGPPRVKIESVTQGSFIRSVVLFQVQAFSERTVTGVRLYIADEDFPLAWSPSHQAWIAYVDSARYDDGQHMVLAQATDSDGRTAIEAVSLTIDNTPPSVSILNPRAGDALSGRVPVSSRVDDVYLDSWQFLIDSRPVHDFTLGLYELDTTRLKGGSHNMRIVAVDLAGNVGEASVQFAVDNTAQGGSIIQPASWTQGFFLVLGGAILLPIYAVIRRRFGAKRT